MYVITNIFHMRATSFSELRKNLASELDKVSEDHEPVIITRGKGKPEAVLISLEDFAGYEETNYLLRSPENAKRLKEAVADFEKGVGVEVPMPE